MNKLLYLAGLVLLATGCSTPRYSYNFSTHQYATKGQSVESSIPVLDASTVVASTEATVVLAEPAAASTVSSEVKTVKTYREMNKTERKAFRREVKAEVKTLVKTMKSVKKDQTLKSTQALDKDLKFAALFGAVGLTMLIIGGQVFYVLGAIAMIIGVVFFVQWLIRQ